jgi:thioredoxin-dependent peroxiredoxin
MSDAIEGKLLPSLSLEAIFGAQMDAQAAPEVGKVELPKDLLGKYSVLYFYPKDDTPGCTKQACAYRDDQRKFRELGAQVFGVSLDDLSSHDAFVRKFSLNFPLISDPEHKLADFLGAYGEREWQGKKFMGLSRDTFVIDPHGRVARAFRKVDPLSTAADTYAALQTLIAG